MQQLSRKRRIRFRQNLKRSSDIEELTAVLEQRSRLEGVSKFLEKHGADDEKLCAIYDAIEDLENFLNEELLSKVPI